MTVLFIGSEIYRGSSDGPAHPLREPRVSTVIDLARRLGWLPPALSWGGRGGGRPPPDPRLLTTLADAPRPGPINPDLRDRLAIPARR